ncbi:MAG: CotH kinase family protein, partial [Bacteroidetes bacterium]|nr:CotH kinase family protein [Bacteroidota bacterium]
MRIQIDIPQWFDTLTNDYQLSQKDAVLYPEVSRKCFLTFDGVPVDTIGIRQRGNSSNKFNTVKFKKPFKLEIDAFKNIKLDGLKNINLNNCTDDPSFVREALCYNLVREQGLLAPQTSYAKVYINDQFWGLYMLVENIDKTYLKDQFGGSGNNGNLYKTAQTGQAYMNRISPLDTAFRLHTGLELKTNEDLNDWSRLANFFDLLHNYEAPYFKDSLSKVFDVTAYLKLLCIEKLVYSWDSYWANGNNYYLYEHPDGSIKWISWDMNETFPNKHGLDASRLTGKNYLLPTNRFDSRPLLKAIFSVQAWKDEYYDLVCKILNSEFTVEHIDTTLLQWHKLIDEAVKSDTNKFYTNEAFEGSLMNNLVEADYTFPKSGIRMQRKLPGILPFIVEQRDWADDQIDLMGYDCIVSELKKENYTFQITPNPLTQNSMQLHWEGIDLEGTCQIQVVNILGQVVTTIYNQKSNNNQIKVDLNVELVSGIYWVRKLDTNGFVGISKMVKL